MIDAKRAEIVAEHERQVAVMFMSSTATMIGLVVPMFVVVLAAPWTVWPCVVAVVAGVNVVAWNVGVREP